MNESTAQMSQVFSGRAESAEDASKINVALQLTQAPWEKVTIQNLGPLVGTTRDSGEVGFELHFHQPVAFDQVQQLVRNIEDSHIMLQTLRPLSLGDNTRQHSLARDLTIY